MHRRMVCLAGAVVALVLPMSVSVPTAHAQTASSLLGLVNGLRISRGVPALVADPTLTSVAQQWSAHMAATATLAHNPNLSAQLSHNWGKLGENVGVGGSISGIFNALVADPPHLANLIDPVYNAIGIGVVTGNNGTLWVTQDFEALAGPVQPTPTIASTPAPSSPPLTARPAPPTSTAWRPPPTTVPATTSVRPTTPTTPVVTMSPPVSIPEATTAPVTSTSTSRPAEVKSTAIGALPSPPHRVGGRREWVFALVVAATLSGLGVAAVSSRTRPKLP